MPVRVFNLKCYSLNSDKFGVCELPEIFILVIVSVIKCVQCLNVRPNCLGFLNSHPTDYWYMTVNVTLFCTQDIVVDVYNKILERNHLNLYSTQYL
jgi:hypothetical protein